MPTSIEPKASLELLEEQIYSQRKHVRYDIRDLTFEVIANKYDDSLDEGLAGGSNQQKFNQIYIPEYQRDFTWDIKRQSKFIESLILGLPIPFIFVAENKNSFWEIVDGSQRIRTMHSFFTNNLRLIGLESLTYLNGYSFFELDQARQGKIASTAIRIIVLSEETTDDIKKDMFERINRGSDLLKPMEKRKGIYKGTFNSFIYDYCDRCSRFKTLVKIDKWLNNRQEHEELLLRFFALSEDGAYRHGMESGISSYLDEYIDKKNKEWDAMGSSNREETQKKYEDKINSVLEIVEKYFPYGFRVAHNPQTKRSVFEAISVGVWLVIERNKQINKNITKKYIVDSLKSQEFRQYTHVANELHKKKKLNGRIDYIFQMLTMDKLCSQ